MTKWKKFIQWLFRNHRFVPYSRVNELNPGAFQARKGDWKC